MATSVAVLESALGQRDVSIRFFDDVAFGGSVTVSFSDARVANDGAGERRRLIAKARDIIRQIASEQESAPAAVRSAALDAGRVSTDQPAAMVAAGASS